MTESQHPITLLSLYDEGEFVPAERQAVTEHLEQCPLCQHELHLLRQTAEILEEGSRERAPQDFLDKLTRRIEQNEHLRRLEARRQQTARGQAGVLSDMQAVGARNFSRPTPTVGSWVIQGLSQFWQSLCFPMRLKPPLYAAVSVAVAAAFLFRVFPEGRSPNQDTPPTKTQAATEAPRQELVRRDVQVPQPPDTPTPPPRQVLKVHSPPVPKPLSAQPLAEQELLLPSPPIAALEGVAPIAEPAVWRVVGKRPEAIRAQAKVLAQRISGALIVQEEDDLLLSLPTRQLAAFEQALRELGQVQTMGTEVDLANPTTTVQVRFLFVLDSASLSP